MNRTHGLTPLVPAAGVSVEPINQIRFDNQISRNTIKFGSHLDHQHFPTILFQEFDQSTPEMAYPLQFFFKPDAHVTPLVPDKIFVSDKGPIQTRRRHLQGIRTRRKVMNIQDIAELIADCRTIVQCDPAFPVHINPDHPAGLHSNTLDLDQFETFRLQHRFCQMPDVFPEFFDIFTDHEFDRKIMIRRSS